MVSLIMQKECGCFKKSSYESKQIFQTNTEAFEVAQSMCEDMNKNFCQKHKFTIQNNNNEIIIKMEINK